MTALPLDHVGTVAAASVIVASAVLIRFIIYPIFLSPLSKVPAAHPLACVTPLWIQWRRWRGTEFECIAGAFARKGPYVRLAPNEIAVNAIEAVQNVYGVGSNNFDKHPSYDYFVTQGARNVFTSLAKDHRARRRSISSIYSRSFVQTSPHARAIMHSLMVDRMLPVLTRASASHDSCRGLNVLPLFQSFALDFMSSFAFGVSRSFDFIRDEHARWRWINQFNLSYPPESAFWMKEYPLLVKLLPAVGIAMVPSGHSNARKACEDWALDKVEECEAVVQRAGGDLRSAMSLPPGELPVLYSHVRSGLARRRAGSEKGFVPDQNDKRELASTMFTYMIYELSRHEKIQDQLRQEFLAIEAPFLYDGSLQPCIALPSPQSLERLPFLDCVIKESLRLRNNAPNLDPRVTPAKPHCKVGLLTNLPPGVRVGTYGWCLNRNAEVFPRPESWEPHRWQCGGPEAAARRGQWLFAFGGGSRGCIGQQVAMELMRLLLCGIYTNFRTTVADESEYPGANEFVGSDCKKKLFIRFEKLGNL
ncbi:Unspecific monooxygenase [Purpureocillium takamizusanense]|uniref:Unspecific monooxygenase n=1 Tax=Purpureocillium takamizusanense TaxID=2060973 RepID=A0A9Q8QNU9_9HYPO|nr:Unspecific monooxygenase [Purpureocillium takamizusanense]UNI23078.1 Unspecific monooxygenase [Purpureocillium takamizusanense]